MPESRGPAWIAESLRGTVFGGVSLDEARDWWAEYLDVEPDSETVKAKAGQYSAHCEFMGGVLVLEAQPGRADWHVRSKRPEEMGDLDFPNIGGIDEPLSSFREIFNKWLSDRTGLARMAFGAVLLLPTEDRRAAYESVQSMLPAVTLDVENSADFFYQINRPRQATTEVEGLVLNRLCKWSVLRLFGGMYRVDSDKSLVSTAMEERFAVRLELDINTSLDFPDVLPIDRQSDIFDELIKLGIEISQNGDQP